MKNKFTVKPVATTPAAISALGASTSADLVLIPVVDPTTRGCKPHIPYPCVRMRKFRGFRQW